MQKYLRVTTSLSSFPSGKLFSVELFRRNYSGIALTSYISPANLASNSDSTSQSDNLSAWGENLQNSWIQTSRLPQSYEVVDGNNDDAVDKSRSLHFSKNSNANAMPPVWTLMLHVPIYTKSNTSPRSAIIFPTLFVPTTLSSSNLSHLLNATRTLASCLLISPRSTLLPMKPTTSS